MLLNSYNSFTVTERSISCHCLVQWLIIPRGLGRGLQGLGCPFGVLCFFFSTLLSSYYEKVFIIGTVPVAEEQHQGSKHPWCCSSAVSPPVVLHERKSDFNQRALKICSCQICSLHFDPVNCLCATAGDQIQIFIRSFWSRVFWLWGRKPEH